MLRIDREALECDLAETYHILDIRALPPYKVALFACGLRAESRIKMKLANQKYPYKILLMANIIDQLSILNWLQSGGKRKKPPSLYSKLMDLATERESRDYMVYNSPDDFEKAREKLLKRE